MKVAPAWNSTAGRESRITPAFAARHPARGSTSTKMKDLEKFVAPGVEVFTESPDLLVGFIGLGCAVAFRRRYPGPCRFVIAALSVFLFTVLVRPWLLRYLDDNDLDRWTSAVVLSHNYLQALALGLLLAAVFVNRDSTGGPGSAADARSQWFAMLSAVLLAGGAGLIGAVIARAEQNLIYTMGLIGLISVGAALVLAYLSRTQLLAKIVLCLGIVALVGGAGYLGWMLTTAPPPPVE